MNMKKYLLVFSLVVFTGINAIMAACTPRPSQPDSAGLDPTWEQLPCIKRNTPYNEVIYVQNFGQVNSSIRVEWLEVNEFRNVPSGLSATFTYPAGNPPRRLLSDQTGCIEISGTTSAPKGDYRLGIVVCVKLNLFNNPLCGPADSLVAQLSSLVPNLPNFDFFLRVIEPNETCPDTSLIGTAQTGGTTIVPTANPVGISELKTLHQITISPNPVQDKFTLSFSAEEKGNYTLRLIDATGKEVLSQILSATPGNNRFDISLPPLPKGIYLFNIHDGKAGMSKKILVE